MAPTSLSFVFVLLSLLSASILSEAAAPGPLLGGYQPTDPKDPEVVKVANFAVTEHNKEAKTNLVYVTVLKAEKQVVAGLNYRLVLTAKDGAGESKNYQAVVWSKPWEKFLKLVSFEPFVKLN